MYFSDTKHALRKTPYLPNHICCIYVCAVYLRRKLAFMAILLVRLTNQFDAFFNPKNVSETNATNNAQPTWKTYEFSRHRCCFTLKFGDNVNHSHSDRCQPRTTVKHERHNVVARVRRCRMTKLHAQLNGMQTEQGLLFRDVLVRGKKRLESMWAFFQDRLQRIHKFGSGDMPFSVRRASYRSNIPETAVLLLRKDKFYENIGGEIV